jgi:hypothetical protein
VTIQIDLKFEFNFELCIRRKEIVNYSHVHVYFYRLLCLARFIEMGLISHWRIYQNLVLPSVNYISLHTKL